MSGITDQMPRRAKWMLVLSGSAAVALALLATAAFVVAASRSIPPVAAVDITACRPDSYGPVPEVGVKGPKQSDCSRWFDTAGQRMQSSRSVEVAGQVCIDHDEPVAYEVQVAWEALESSARAIVLETPLTWDPGCAEPYSFVYSFPDFLVANAEQGESLGRWRLVGKAVPVDPARFSTYQWDATGSVEVMAE